MHTPWPKSRTKSHSYAAALPVVFFIAHYSLFKLTHLEEGESILIYSGVGGVGQAAIQLATLLKANIFTTVGTKEEKKLLTDAYGILENHIFSSRDGSFARALMEMTGGVDVILNSLSGEGLFASWSCIRSFGHFIELGNTGFQQRGCLPIAPFA